MTDKRKQTLITAAVILLFLATVVAMYLLYLQPKQKELETTEETLKTEKAILAAHEERLETSKAVTFDQTVMLQKRVPVKQLIEQIVLNIEKAEILSQSFVLTMDLGDGETEEESEPEQVEIDLEKENETEQTNSATDTEAAIEIKPMPNGVKKIVVDLTVESPSYFDMEKFLSTIENDQRIFVIEKLEFEGIEEVISLDQEEKPVTYSVTIAAFYMPTLTELIDELPTLEVPVPSKKKDPFNSFAELESDSKQESE